MNYNKILCILYWDISHSLDACSPPQHLPKIHLIFSNYEKLFFSLKNKIKQKIPFSSPLSPWASLIYFLIVATIASYHYFQHL